MEPTDLKSVLEYRDKCVICQRKLKFYVNGHKNLQCFINERGLRIKSNYKNGISMTFNFDGSYSRDKQANKIYAESLIVFKYCTACQTKPILLPVVQQLGGQNVVLKSRTAGMTTGFASAINNIKKLACNYSFAIAGWADRYGVDMDYESIRYYNAEYFYHIDNSFVGDSAILTHSRFDAPVEGILSLKVDTTINLSKICNTDQFVDKCRKLILFS